MKRLITTLVIIVVSIGIGLWIASLLAQDTAPPAEIGLLPVADPALPEPPPSEPTATPPITPVPVDDVPPPAVLPDLDPSLPTSPQIPTREPVPSLPETEDPLDATLTLPDSPDVVIPEEGAADTLQPLTVLQLRGEVWADNWFALYANGQLVKEDSVSINTERSFNAETFTFSAELPVTLAFVAKDFKENDTGLEYIGTNRQQMGDGGLIAQFTDTASGDVIAVTDSSFRCYPIHQAPSDKACANDANPVAGVGNCGFTSRAEPSGWKLGSFDDSAWSQASVYSSATVRPKDGYNTISWSAQAQFIWGADLETDNTVLCRTTVTSL